MDGYLPSMADAALEQNISVEEYLAGEVKSSTKYEYLNGVVHAMAGAQVQHDRVVRQVLTALVNGLGDGLCEAFTSDMKVRVRQGQDIRFYYPDAQVVCGAVDEEATFQDEPRLIVEVLSDSTRRTDMFEKRDAYFSIPTLDYYLLIEPTVPQATLYRREAEGFSKETFFGREQVIKLPRLRLKLEMARIYPSPRA